MPTKSFNTTAKPLLYRMQNKHRAACRRIWDQEFGFYDSDESDLNAACEESDDKYSYGVVAKDVASDEIIGFGIAQATNPDHAADYFCDTVDLDFPDWTILMHVSCVRSDWQGRGIGSRIFEERLRWGHHCDANGFAGTSWIREGRYGSSALFESHGFERLATVEEYYDRHFESSTCVDCGEPCLCDAAVYWRDEQ